MVSGVRIERRHQVAALVEIDRELKASIDALSDVSQKVELRKSLERLKRSVADAKTQKRGDGKSHRYQYIHMIPTSKHKSSTSHFNSFCIFYHKNTHT